MSSDKGTNEQGLSFQQEWKDSYRTDLLPPENVNGEFVGDWNSVALLPDVKKGPLKDILDQEGVTGGRPVKFIHDARRTLPQLGEIKGSKRKVDSLLGALVLGSCGRQDRETVIRINAGLIYDIALILSPGSIDEVQPKFNRLYRAVMVHEIGHARQPEDISRIPIKTLIKIELASFTIVDLVRRSQLPFLWLLEGPIMQTEAIVAAGITDLFYRLNPAERFAHEYYKDASKKVWKDIITSRVSSSDKLEHDYLWARINRKEIVNKLSGVFGKKPENK